MLSFGIWQQPRLVGAILLGSGPANAHALVSGAGAVDCLVLTRLWLSDELPRNSESRILGVLLRSLRSSTDVKFLVSYADPAAGHVGTIYQASGWLYTGLSQGTPLYALGDGPARHSRSFSASLGTRSRRYWAAQGIDVRLVPQAPKHRYLAFLDPAWQSRLRVSVLPYPKKEKAS